MTIDSLPLGFNLLFLIAHSLRGLETVRGSPAKVDWRFPLARAGRAVQDAAFSSPKCPRHHLHFCVDALLNLASKQCAKCFIQLAGLTSCGTVLIGFSRPGAFLTSFCFRLGLLDAGPASRNLLANERAYAKLSPHPPQRHVSRVSLSLSASAQWHLRSRPAAQALATACAIPAAENAYSTDVSR